MSGDMPQFPGIPVPPTPKLGRLVATQQVLACRGRRFASHQLPDSCLCRVMAPTPVCRLTFVQLKEQRSLLSCPDDHPVWGRPALFEADVNPLCCRLSGFRQRKYLCELPLHPYFSLEATKSNRSIGRKFLPVCCLLPAQGLVLQSSGIAVSNRRVDERVPPFLASDVDRS